MKIILLTLTVLFMAACSKIQFEQANSEIPQNPIPTPVSLNSIGSFDFKSMSATTGNVLALPYQSSSEDEGLGLYWSTPNPLIKIIDLGNNQYQLRETDGGRCLTVSGISVTIKTCDPSLNQTFSFATLTNGSISIQNSAGCLSAAAAFAPILVSSCDGSLSQSWNPSGLTSFSPHFVLSLAPTPAPTPTPVPTPLPEAWTSCATEDGVCYFTGTKTVRFGVPGFYNYKNFTGSANCSAHVFGDPNWHYYKGCDVDVNSSPTTSEVQNSVANISSSNSIIPIDQVSDLVFWTAESYFAPFDWGSSGGGRSYIEYTIIVTEPGTYTASLTVSTNVDSSGLELLVDAVSQGTVAMTSTGGHSYYLTRNFGTVSLASGMHRFRIHNTSPTASINVSGVQLIKN